MRRVNVKAVAKGIACGLAVLLAGYSILLLWVLYGAREVYYLTFYIKLLFFTALAVAGLVGGMTAGWQGWRHGGWIGMTVSLATVFFWGLLIPEQVYSLTSVIGKLAYGAFLGGAAAVCGVNLAFVQRRRRFNKRIKKNSIY
ncbi:MAG: hypothetical protein H0Z35_06230 [Thermoanaerobacteraceae bacterium]|nr:hypothetical protein [Thermoanaerobacteraceae bacterium]